jgi:hypothetical protein
MNRDSPPEPRPAAPARSTAKRIAVRALVALFATGVWWVILDAGGRALGYHVAAAWLAPVLVCIFLLLMLGLSMADMAARSTRAASEARRGDDAKSPQRRRAHGARARFR